MPIKIIKKREAGPQRTPAPIVEAPAPIVAKAPAPAPAPKSSKHPAPTLCSFCEHPYIEPCHGKSDACMNARWKRERLAKEAAK